MSVALRYTAPRRRSARLLAGCLLLGLALPAAGEVRVVPDTRLALQPGLSVIAAAGPSIGIVDRSEFQKRLDRAGLAATVNDVDTRATALELAMAYALTDNWGIRVGYLDFGRFDADVTVPAAQLAALRSLIGNRYPKAGRGMEALIDGHADLGPWVVTGSVGAFMPLNRYVEITANGQTLRDKGPASSIVLGAGVGYRVFCRWIVGLDVRATELNGRVIAPMATLRYGI